MFRGWMRAAGTVARIKVQKLNDQRANPPTSYDVGCAGDARGLPMALNVRIQRTDLEDSVKDPNALVMCLGKVKCNSGDSLSKS